MSELQNHDSIHKQQSWPRKALLTRTKPIDSFSDLCQQLTNVVAQQTALSDKLIEAFRETKEIGQNNLQIPYRENNRYTPSPELLEEPNRQIFFKVPSVESPDEEMKFGGLMPGVMGEECLNGLNTIIEMVRSCNNAAMNQLRSVLTGQVHQENIPNALSQVYSMMTLITAQCGNFKTSITDVERILRQRNFHDSESESKYTQTISAEVESDPEDKDSGLESNPGRNSETGVSLEDFQLYTDYDELMQATIPDESEQAKRRPSFLKDKKNSCPTHLLQKKIHMSNLKNIEVITEGSIDEDATNTLGENNSVGKPLDDTIVCSSKSSEVFSPQIEPAGIQSFPVDYNEPIPEKKKLNSRPPKLAKLQRAMTMCVPESGRTGGVSDGDESLSLNLTQSSGESERDAERDFANLENQVNIIKFNYSTNSFTCKGRKEGLKQLVYSTRKQVSCEMSDLIDKLASKKRRKGSGEETAVSVEEMMKSFLVRIDYLVQVSQHFGATLHEITHSDEKEILINFIEVVKTLHRPSSMTNNGPVNFTFQKTDSVVSSGENERRSASPTSGRYCLKSMETTYEKGIKDGVEFMKDTLQMEMQTTNQKLEKFYRYSTEIDTVLNSEMKMKNNFLLSYGSYIVSILVISVILMFVM
eukprot:TRINITY_DN15425_c0_g1_i1.p1 TRINITY_DN15425_c0_g1~~TRINITY_DN15425_c0_g1_i1.p1  ORF type:complete len:643 (-),score=146.52 TRINITY_DN15425_c0_g1_i1:50-1978(-)